MARRQLVAQLDLLDWQPPTVTEQFDEHQVRAATLVGRIAHGVAACLRDADRRDLGREEIAVRMSSYLGERVSKAMLDAYASEARADHIISLPRLMALVHVTGDRRLLELLTEPFGWCVVPRRFLALIELAALREHEDEMKRRGDALRRRARAEGAL